MKYAWFPATEPTDFNERFLTTNPCHPPTPSRLSPQGSREEVIHRLENRDPLDNSAIVVRHLSFNPWFGAGAARHGSAAPTWSSFASQGGSDRNVSGFKAPCRSRVGPPSRTASGSWTDAGSGTRSSRVQERETCLRQRRASKSVRVASFASSARRDLSGTW